MSDDQIIALLTEIRDLQKQNVENSRLALQRQQEAIGLQKQNVAEFKEKFVARQKMVILAVIAIVIVSFILVALMPSLIRINH